MRRLVVLIIMLVVPLQFAWSAALGVHGHPDDVPVGMHLHDPDHHDTGHVQHAPPDASPLSGDTQGSDCHHVSHCHHVFSFILYQFTPPTGPDLKAGPILHAPDAFLSRIPPLLDRPPLARA